MPPLMSENFMLVTIAAAVSFAADHEWDVRTRTKKSDAVESVQTARQAWSPAKTAIVVIDMWDDHHCKSAAARVTEMAPTMNEALKAARKLGVTIVHSPSD